MKRIILFVSIFLLLASGPAVAANKFWWGSCLTGGGDCLDGIDGDDITIGDGAAVARDAGSTEPEIYFYRAYGSSASESSPFVIAPDTDPGTKRWHLVKVYAKSFNVPPVDGENRIIVSNNTSRAPAASSMEIYPEANIWKLNVNGTEYILGPIDDAAGNGDTSRAWSADKAFDQLALKPDLAGTNAFTGANTIGDAGDDQIVKLNVNAADGTFSGFTITRTVDASAAGSAFGQPMYVASDGELDTADADVAGKFPSICILVTAGTGASKQCLTHGTVTETDWNWTPGAILYLSTAPGTTTGITASAPSGSGNAVQRIGVALSADTLLFSPSLDVVVLE